MSTRRRRSWRWLRLAVPFTVLFTLWLVTAVAHAVEEPDLDEPGTLSPLGTGPDGSSVLAQRLAGRSVVIERVTSSHEAVRKVGGSDATIFVPTPDFLVPGFLSLLDDLAGAHRVVVVQPGLRTMLYSSTPIFEVRNRWATATVNPRCPESFATAAGAAAVLNSAYEADAPTSINCYVGGLVGIVHNDTEIIYVGASDPFRNGRIGESGNAALAMGLLSEHNRVIWVDVHEREPVSRSPDDIAQLPQYRRGERDRGGTGDPTIDAFPPMLWAALVLGLVAAVLVALARARRLGAPVAEPLPVLVPAAETVTGRGRLYQRVGARAATLDALRDAAVTRIARALDPFGAAALLRELHTRAGVPGPSAEALLGQIVAHTGMSAPAVRTILFGPPPANDDELRRAVADLDALVETVLRDNATRYVGGQP